MNALLVSLLATQVLWCSAADANEGNEDAVVVGEARHNRDAQTRFFTGNQGTDNAIGAGLLGVGVGVGGLLLTQAFLDNQRCKRENPLGRLLGLGGRHCRNYGGRRPGHHGGGHHGGGHYGGGYGQQGGYVQPAQPYNYGPPPRPYGYGQVQQPYGYRNEEYVPPSSQNYNLPSTGYQRPISGFPSSGFQSPSPGSVNSGYQRPISGYVDPGYQRPTSLGYQAPLDVNVFKGSEDTRPPATYVTPATRRPFYDDDTSTLFHGRSAAPIETAFDDASTAEVGERDKSSSNFKSRGGRVKFEAR